jgi:hypothetical protein
MSVFLDCAIVFSLSTKISIGQEFVIDDKHGQLDGVSPLYYVVFIQVAYLFFSSEGFMTLENVFNM